MEYISSISSFHHLLSISVITILGNAFPTYSISVCQSCPGSMIYWYEHDLNGTNERMRQIIEGIINTQVKIRKCDYKNQAKNLKTQKCKYTDRFWLKNIFFLVFFPLIRHCVTFLVKRTIWRRKWANTLRMYSRCTIIPSPGRKTPSITHSTDSKSTA